jgi:hypothetical protein
MSPRVEIIHGVAPVEGDGEEESLHQAGSRMPMKATSTRTPAPSASSA